MSSATTQRPNGLALFILPSALLFALFFFLPIGLMALMSVLTGNPVVAPKVAFTTRHYARMIDDPFYLEVIWTTIRIGLVTTLVALAIGYPLAHWMARIKSRTGHALLLMAVLAPMLTGIVVRTFAWMTLLSDKGVVNQTLMSLGVISQPLKLMYTETGIVVGLVHIYVPFMVLTLTGVIGRIDERLEQAAENLGASPLRAFLEVTLPLSLPGILAGSLLVFALAISAYVTPILLGGFQIMTLPILIYQQISANFNVGFAAALGIVLLMISLGLVVAYNRALGLVSGQRELQ
ncbi:putative spermidine/putrescine transport system permease protein [Bradyrhizobium diazoefficiens]|uniref:ABC transporter permease protein n=1 Tax=Bradyrhizobium diazoefficiens (strain JCM 10833 / BCRC 13528 / IAM 13628 / NBRC 14792 / USDA 110) TaxID=224911 RepID=Q89Q86_BRADU|nr:MULTISPECIES: ABC transporter permease [Bradyrhizobium]MBP1066807.1 putative spermidine/putrescine transport system permease protein [Bradyrhizobium japonicum]AND88676.1 ABC transporter permease [Bradyrhizobium diazoefficiens USDA 110]AWO90231.1 ABC transporter permease [Bradyrhizobium diazoefficiens]MDA9394599.1 ABC transporter permease [Bradyrhizobium sp. CCBAU 45394]MDA9542788.1 ABC transporter permease [Bradyrhizobium sp. CCBAU 21362]